jgi:AcrR family transcriptional regulator
MAKQKKQEVKKKIISVARELLNKRDYRDVVIDEIAKKSGVAKGTIFFHFKSKENFVREIFNSSIEEICNLIDDIVKKDVSTIEKLKLLYDNYIDNVSKNMHLFMMLRKEMVREDCRIKKVAQKEYQKIAQKIFPIIKQGYKENVFKKYVPLPVSSRIITSLVFAYGMAVVHFVSQIKTKNEYEKIKEIFWQTLL